MEIFVALFLLVLFCSSCILVGEVSNPIQDPFARPPRVGQGQGIVLEGIIEIAGKQCVALACGTDHEVLQTGGLFHGFTVTNINQTEVELVNDTEKRVLRID